MQDFTNLRVWKAAHELRLCVYKETRSFPREELFGLTSQIRRSTASIAANIAEACGYRGGADSARLIQIALGSACETLDHLIAARDLGLLKTERFTKLAAQLGSVRGMLLRLLARMRQ